MLRMALTVAAVVFLVAGCGGQQDPAVKDAAERIIKLGGSFIPRGLTVPVKSVEKFPPGAFQIQKVDLNGTHARDEDIELLKNLKQLEILHLQASYITDKGMPFLQEMKSLTELNLHDSRYFTDAGLDALQTLPRLSKLEVSKTNVSDASIERLSAMKQLSQLHLNNTRITVDGGKKLREALPNCKIYGPK